MHCTGARTSVCISRNSSPVWTEAPGSDAAALPLELNAILNRGISAEIDLPVRSVEGGESSTLVSPFRGGVVKECRGARGGHRGKGKDACSRILKVTHGWKLKRRCLVTVLSRCYVKVTVTVIVAWGGRYRWCVREHLKLCIIISTYKLHSTAPVSQHWRLAFFSRVFRFGSYV